jgi:hypothetical protein
MQVTGAVIREQGITFAVVIVKPHVIHDTQQAQSAIAEFTPIFRTPVVLMAQEGGGRPRYYGRKDIAQFMSRVPLQAIPWKKYTIN